MLIDLKQAIKKHGLKITGVVHVGSHVGQEMEDYLANGIKDIVFIEPCKETFEKLKEHVGDKAICFNVACGETSGQMVLHKETANGGMSNSLLEPTGHLNHYPDIKFIDSEVVDVCPLDSLPIEKSRYNFLVMDCQGFEANVLKGAKNTLQGIEYIMTEVNYEELYKGLTLYEGLLKLIPEFEVIETKRTGQNWGDCLLKRKRPQVLSIPAIFQQRELKHYPPGNINPFEEFFLDRYRPEDNNSDRIYLPVLWTEYFKYNHYGKHKRGMQNLQDFLNKLDRSKKYFSVIQYDDHCLSNTKHLDIKWVALGCRGDYQLPLLCQPHGKREVERNLFANFIGKRTHPIREQVFNLKGKDYFISDQNTPIDAYTYIMASSVFTLCPRGYGKTSFRIAEALEQGSIPVYISDEFLEPMDFERYGVKINPGEDIDKRLREVESWQILHKQNKGKEVYEKYFSFEGAYNQVINYLNGQV